MATYTENYNLEKPSLDEVVDVNVDASDIANIVCVFLFYY